MVFDSRTRTYLGPRDHGEPQYAFLDRSERPPFEAAQQRINDWYSCLCHGLKDGVLHRLRSGNDQEFDAAFWQLYPARAVDAPGLRFPANPPRRGRCRWCG
jgi:hypothetical protein